MKEPPVKSSVVLDRATLLNLMNILVPRSLGKATTMYDVGYERAKEEMRVTLARALGLPLVDSEFQQLRDRINRNGR